MADRVLVEKSERRLMLLRGDEVLREMRINLGLRPTGHKEREGDFRTPEGDYLLVERNRNSDFFLSIRVSYPDAQDIARARRNGWNPGGQIMVHGQPNRPSRPPQHYRNRDWTDGCIALSNSDMVDFWLMTREFSPIRILP
ncbi:MAG: L,D-transpeptidase family protein [Chromatiales bacterium]|nr:L,D-transpeptidase family protein [Chromatiales bacterium]